MNKLYAVFRNCFSRSGVGFERAAKIAAKVEAFVREQIIPYQSDKRRDAHPLADFAYHAMIYRTPPSIAAGLAHADIGAPDTPIEAEYIAAYRRRTGRQAIPDYNFCVAFNFFRLAAR